jgi:hypothetical protein
MRNIIILIIMLAAATVPIISCNVSSVKKNYTLCDSYAKVNLSERRIAVVFPSDNSIVINNKKDVIDDLGGINSPPEKRIRKFYFPEFMNSFRSHISGDSVFDADSVIEDVSFGDLDVREVMLRTSSDSMEQPYHIFKKEDIENIDLQDGVLLIMNEVGFKRNKFKSEYFWDDKTRKSANLEAYMKIILWDYKADAPVFYGTITQHTIFNFNMQRKHWLESARDIAKKIVKDIHCL